MPVFLSSIPNKILSAASESTLRKKLEEAEEREDFLETQREDQEASRGTIPLSISNSTLWTLEKKKPITQKQPNWSVQSTLVLALGAEFATSSTHPVFESIKSSVRE